MPNDVPTWENKVKTYFTQPEVACMSAENANLDLGDYDSVVAYISASERNKNTILEYLADGTMPQGGRKWSRSRFDKFKAWIDAGFPKS